jgi:transcriptional regulator with XRE-family HTH domain
MTVQEPTAAPDRFVRLLDKSINAQRLSLREVARRIDVSIAYLSRLLNKQRGLPADKTITKMEKALQIEPGVLFDAAGRHDAIASKVLKNDKARQLLRSLEPLTDQEFAQVLKVAQDLATKYHPDAK